MKVELRKHPYPYAAMLAICSDLDETPDLNAYLQSSLFLNTEKATVMGKGVGLEVGNSIYFAMPPEQFSYWNTDAAGREKIIQLIKAGFIDSVHSFGDLINSRAEIERAWHELQQNGCQLNVWIDHARAPTNFDEDIMFGTGATIGAAAYHADLTCEQGLQFIWKGRVTSVVAQNVARSLRGIFNIQQPLASFKTIAIEILKGWLALLGNQKYAMHGANKVLRHTALADGHQVYEFMRTNPSWAGVSVFETARGIHQVITPRFLHRLVKAGGSSILYTHLGKSWSKEIPFDDLAVSAFRLLKRYCDEKQILVATTRRVLGYCRMVETLDYKVVDNKGLLEVHLSTPFPPEDYQGLTWYVDDPRRVAIFINGVAVSYVQINAPDATGRPSVSIPWSPLIYPDL